MRGWLTLASHLGCSLEKVMDETTSSNFLLWCAYLKEKNDQNDKDDYRFAMLGQEIRRSYVKKGAAVRLKHFLLKWTKPKPLSKEEYLKRSKAGWFGLLGIKQNG